MLSAEAISFSYGRVAVLDGASVRIRPGTVTALFGPNGTGKSTLFRCIMGLLRHGGDVRIGGESTRSWGARELARHVAFVPQDHRAAFPHTVRDVVTMGVAARTSAVFGPAPADVALALGHLDRMGLSPLADRAFTALSGGQRQLVLIARALTQQSPYLLFDEPTAALDFGNQQAIWRTIRTLAHRDGKGVLVCSHDPNHVLWFCDEAIVLARDGRTSTPRPVGEVITEDLLGRLYPEPSTVAALDGLPVVVPRTV